MPHTPCWICLNPATHTFTHPNADAFHACDHHTRTDQDAAKTAGWTITPINHR